MNKKDYVPRIYIRLTAFWGNGDAESSIRVSRRMWKKIKEGMKFSFDSTGWYEGTRQKVCWSFIDGKVDIDGEDGRQCIVGDTINSLIVNIEKSQKQSS